MERLSSFSIKPLLFPPIEQADIFKATCFRTVFVLE